MALVLKNRVKETSNTTGTGSLTLLGASTGYQSFSTAIGNGNTTYYTLYDNVAQVWEVGIGTYTASGTTLSRDTVLDSSASGAKVNFSSGTQWVWCDYPAGKAIYTDASGNISNLAGGISSVNTLGFNTSYATALTTGQLAFDTANAAATQTYAGVIFNTANISFRQANSAFGKANAAFSVANAAFAAANTGAQAQLAYGQANAAFANRQVITHQIREAFAAVFGRSGEELGMELVYDVAHNIAKVERYPEGELVVHRKGATRALGPGSQDLPACYRSVGQPVICGGSMETGSYLLVGTARATDETFGSTMHGSGRTMSRTQAKKSIRGEQLQQQMKQRGILVKAVSMSGLAEEAGFAYKNISEVVESVDRAGITKKVAELRPIGNIKG